MYTSNRERMRDLIGRKGSPGPAFWLGNPDGATWPLLMEATGVDSPDAVRAALGDDLVWIPGMVHFRWPQGGSGSRGPLADCEDVAELDNYEWPEASSLDFGPTIEALRAAGDRYRASGMWSCFYHDVAGLFGMEDYFVKMHTHPDVVEEVTRRVCTFYIEANKRLFEQAGDLIDAFFSGNDLGTQRGLMVSRDMLRKFVLPWMARMAADAHSFGLQVLVHSCGAVSELIEDFIGMGVDGLHPLQALATGMEASSLGLRFGGRIAFIGGVDTQQLLIKGTPEDVTADVARIREAFGPYLVVSPSHEAILPDAKMENVLAMAKAAKRG